MKRLFVIFALTIVTMSASAQLLYKISGKGLSSPSYIVGTYHLAPASFADSSRYAEGHGRLSADLW